MRHGASDKEQAGIVYVVSRLHRPKFAMMNLQPHRSVHFLATLPLPRPVAAGRLNGGRCGLVVPVVPRSYRKHG